MSAQKTKRVVKKQSGLFSREQLIAWLLPPGLLAALTTLLYYRSLSYPFQFDDIANITKKFAIRFDNPLSRWWGSSRWVGEFLNSLNFQIGRFDPFFYRLFNLVIHISAGVLLYYLIRDLCSYLKSKPFFYENRVYIAFCTAALFLLHPVQTQTVSYVIQARLEGLATLFTLITLYLFINAVRTKDLYYKILSIALFFFSGFLAAGTKEIVVVIPFLLLLVDWFFVSEESWDKFKGNLWLHALFDAFFLSIVFYHLGRHVTTGAVMGNLSTGNNRGNILTGNAFDTITPFRFFYSELKVVLHYLWMFVWPFGISVEYDWRLADKFFSFEVLAPFLILSSFGISALRSMVTKKNSFAAFGFFWFLIGVAPRSTFIPSPELVCDYKTYLASIGVMFILGVMVVSAVLWVVREFKNLPPVFNERNGKLALISIFMVPVMFAAYDRNSIWETCIAFWQDNAKKAPAKARVHNNLGVAYSEAGKIDEAIVAYKKAIALDKVYSDPLSNIAVAYSMKGQVDDAIESLRAAIHICPNYPEAYNNMGSLLIQKKAYDDAERALNFAVQLRPYYGKAFYNLARLYETKGEAEKSWEYLKKAASGDLDTPEIFYKLGQLSLKVKKFDEAAAAFEHVVKVGVNESQVWFGLANAYFMQQKFESAQTIYERLVRDNPLDSRYHFNLAETYFSQKKFKQALETFQKSTSLPKPLPQAFFRTANCLEQLDRAGEAQTYLEEVYTLNAPDEFKKMVKQEITRIELQSKVKAGNGSVTLTDLNKAFARHGGVDEVKKIEGDEKKEATHSVKVIKS